MKFTVRKTTLPKRCVLLFLLSLTLMYSGRLNAQSDFMEATISLGYSDYYNMVHGEVGVYAFDGLIAQLELGIGEEVMAFGIDLDFSVYHFSGYSALFVGGCFGIYNHDDPVLSDNEPSYVRANVGFKLEHVMVRYSCGAPFNAEYSLNSNNAFNQFSVILFL